MATRGRESNRLYVDTTYDPDVATSHEDATEADQVEVLEGVIRTSGAELSATATRRAEEEAADAEWRVRAQGGAVLDVYRQRRIAAGRREQARPFDDRGRTPGGPRL
jgi:hypothetical protein